jgi:very-short-patch-repair endonuclease
VDVRELGREVGRRGGIARTRELLRAGATRGDLARAIACGALLRPRRGLYAVPALDAPTQEALSHGGLLACMSACEAYGLWVLRSDDDRPHVWVDRARHPTRIALARAGDEADCCTIHRDDSTEPAGRFAVGIVHALTQLLRCRGEEVFFAALESALRQGLLSEAARARLRASVPQPARWLVDFARSDADSGLESLLRLRLHRRGLELASQVPIPGVGDVDFVLGDCLILEADGKTHDGEARHRDRVRDAVAMTLGFSTLRFDYALIVHDWAVVETSVLAAVHRGLHRSALGLRRDAESEASG